MHRSISRAVLGCVLALPIAAFAAKATVGQPAPDFALPDVHDKPLKLSDFAGKYVVLECINDIK